MLAEAHNEQLVYNFEDQTSVPVYTTNRTSKTSGSWIINNSPPIEKQATFIYSIQPIEVQYSKVIQERNPSIEEDTASWMALYDSTKLIRKGRLIQL